MSKIFFEQFNLLPDHYLDVESNSPAEFVGDAIVKIDALIQELQPKIVLAVGDVNSTLAASIAANKNGVLLGHIESGLRSNDRTMPEEINRIITDELADFHFITEESGIKNLRSEGKKEQGLYMVGNTMIDTLVNFEEEIDRSTVLSEHSISPSSYFLLTMHRPANVDSEDQCTSLVDLIAQLTAYERVVFPVHPRTKNNLINFGRWESLLAIDKLTILEPLDYFAFQKLIKEAKLVITDSGGIQEETTFRRVPCITLRENTERPSTTDIGSNYLIGFNLKKIIELIEAGYHKESEIPELWDGKATERIVSILAEIISKH